MPKATGKPVAEYLSQSADRGQYLVQRRAGAHRGSRLGIVRLVIATDIHGLALCGLQLLQNLGFRIAERSGDGFELVSQFDIVRLCGQRFCPVHSQVEMATTVIQTTTLRSGDLLLSRNFEVA